MDYFLFHILAWLYVCLEPRAACFSIPIVKVNKSTTKLFPKLVGTNINSEVCDLYASIIPGYITDEFSPVSTTTCLMMDTYNPIPNHATIAHLNIHVFKEQLMEEGYYCCPYYILDQLEEIWLNMIDEYDLYEPFSYFNSHKFMLQMNGQLLSLKIILYFFYFAYITVVMKYSGNTTNNLNNRDRDEIAMINRLLIDDQNDYLFGYYVFRTAATAAIYKNKISGGQHNKNF
ncbi:hypothetical protein ACJX0J_031433 [Zea mays]